MHDPREIPIEPLVLSVSDEERAALQATLGGTTTITGTAVHAMFEALAERGFVKEACVFPNGSAWKLSGDGFLFVDNSQP